MKIFTKKRLKLGLLLFFLALLIPTVLLIQQSYSRLKWETYHQHQLMAAELSERIDNNLIQLISNEDQRPFSDFSFLKAPANIKTSVIQRSPLSEFPVESNIPGLLGYFQVDATGQLLTPVVPVSHSNDYGIPHDELVQRIALENELQDILAANQLVQKPLAPTALSKLQASSLQTSASEQPRGTARGITRETAIEETAAFLEDQESIGVISSSSHTAPAEQESASDSLSGSNIANQPQVQQAPITFDQLKESGKKSAKKSDFGRVEDLQIQQNYLQKDEAAEVKLKKPVAARQQRKTTSRTAKPAPEESQPSVAKPRIRTFESEIDPFEFSQLDSGHFVLFRKVWLNGQRYTQGLLIEQATFLAETIQREFVQTNLSTMSDLVVAYQGNVLTAFSGEQAQDYQSGTRQIIDKQLGEQLYQIRLSDPVSDLQLLYSITQLPIGSGGRLILWLSLVLGTVLLGGFYLMYRLGLSQINLVNQQQDFVSAVSHELKTPLTSIRMYGELLREGWATEEKKKTYYQFIYDESERLTRLINNVLQLARMTRNEQKAELTDRNVAELAQEIKTKITSQIEVAEFTLEVETDESLKESQIRVDSDWLIQIMINLVDNALKFSAKSDQKTIIFGVKHTDAQHVQFTISDFGPGIDKQQMKKIFELFYRSENELTRDTVGTGIGLSLVQQMASGMDGRVSVKNRGLQGNFPGAAFNVIFPVRI